MKVLIVDEDMLLSNSIQSLFCDEESSNEIDTYIDLLKLEHDLMAKEEQYDLCFLDIDLLGQELNTILPFLKNSKIIGFTSNLKLLGQIINRPIFQRLFQKPISSEDIIRYLRIQYKIKAPIKRMNMTKSDIVNTLLDLGFSASHNGTMFLASCIAIAINNRLYKLNDVYKKLEEDIGKPSSTINWSINYSINQANSEYSNNRLSRYFNVKGTRKVTAKIIIDYFVACT